MTELIKYDEACRMLQEAVAVDEVLDVMNQAHALAIYARLAKNLQPEIAAAKIRARAERRLGQMLVEQNATVGLNRGGRPSSKTSSETEQVSAPITLKEAGIDRKLSSRAQRTAAIGDIRFEALMAMIQTQAEAGGRVVFDVLKVDQENEQRTKRRDLARAMSHATVDLPGGRKVACIYADPAWKRKQGITDRSYENHYPTMTWDEICAMPVADRLLPDSWGFLWIPRAHMFALHTVTMEVMDKRTGEMVEASIELPLAWAVARAWGFDSYSTAFVWTKTDEEHPNDIGGGVLVRDQDEILLMFKRGRGLPKPASDEKYTSNHRERKREHSRKPDHYRDMIVSMTGGVPVLELFARVDAEHPLPPEWEAWGNQSQTEDASPCAKPADAVLPIVSPDAAALPAESPAAGLPTTTTCSTATTVSIAESSTDLSGDIIATNRETATPLSELQTLRMIANSDPALTRAAAEHIIVLGLAFEVDPGDEWSLSGDGWDRLTALEEQQSSDEDAAYGALSAEIADVVVKTAADRDVGWEFRTGPGWEMRRSPYDQVEHDALNAIETGSGAFGDGFDDLRSRKLITGKASPKLTKAGKVRLQALDDQRDHRARLNELPVNVQQLVGMYGNHLFKFHDYVVRGDEENAAAERDMLELLQERANGNTNFGVATDDSLAERLRAENRSPVGLEPMWQQRGLFLHVVDGMTCLVEHNEHGNLSVHAVDADKPFLSETGFKSFMGEYALGITVAEQADAYIREAISSVGTGDGKAKKRSKAMSLPASVYRLPEAHEPFEPFWIDQPAFVAGFFGTTGVAGAVRADALADDADPEIVDGVMQCRMPLDGAEFEQRAVLSAIVAGQDLVMVSGLRAEIERDLIGGGLVSVDPVDHHLELTEDGKEWLRRRVDAPNYMAADA